VSDWERRHYLLAVLGRRGEQDSARPILSPIFDASLGFMTPEKRATKLRDRVPGLEAASMIPGLVIELGGLGRYARGGDGSAVVIVEVAESHNFAIAALEPLILGV